MEPTGDGWDQFRRRFEAYGERAGLQLTLAEAEKVMKDKENQ